MQSALLSLHFINVFQMAAWGLLPQRATKYASIYLNDTLKPKVKIGTPSGHAVLNEIQWFILVTFKINIPKNELHELGDNQLTLSVYYGRYISFTSDKTQVPLSKKIGHSSWTWQLLA